MLRTRVYPFTFFSISFDSLQSVSLSMCRRLQIPKTLHANVSSDPSLRNHLMRRPPGNPKPHTTHMISCVQSQRKTPDARDNGSTEMIQSRSLTYIIQFNSGSPQGRLTSFSCLIISVSCVSPLISYIHHFCRYVQSSLCTLNQRKPTVSE